MTRVAFVVADDYEDSEFRQPYELMRQHGHHVKVIGPEAGRPLSGKRGRDEIRPDLGPGDARADAFDVLVIPGGFSPDRLRLSPEIVSLVRTFMEEDRPVAAICHAASLLVEADALQGRRVTSWPSVRKDVENAGGHWVDEPLVRDRNLITSRKPDDLEPFCLALLASTEAVAA